MSKIVETVKCDSFSEGGLTENTKNDTISIENNIKIGITNTNNMLKRFYSDLNTYLLPNKVLIIYGPRRVGKTTLLKEFLATTELKYRLDSGDDVQLAQVLGSGNFKDIKNYVGDNQLIVIDEAQQIDNIGQGLKIIVDQIPGIRVIATGSSSFDLANKLGEPLVGRQTTLTLYPIAQLELAAQRNKFDLKQDLEDYLIYGSYPEVVTAKTSDDKKEIISEIANSYLFKDILALDKIKKSKTLIDLVTLLALQIGSEVSMNELAQKLAVNVKTIEKYLDLLEKTFVLIPVGTFKRNLRDEVRGKKKYYFYDTGIRNAIISQFAPLNLRNDVGSLWENFLFVERMKKCSYQKIYTNRYFWLLYKKAEIDMIEDRDGKLSGYEFKWSKPNSSRAFEIFQEAYSGSELKVINRDNYDEFIM